ncbi:MAG: toll/interleukin-1 receptor domain-containing protein [Opitutales bacterium]|nr:toll/interleukin-1 receptor domain-containing protein [Opitutales bacterium]
MSTFKISDIRNRAAAHPSVRNFSKSASAVLTEATASQKEVEKTYDIFLSHSFRDADLILGVKLKLEDHGHTVYVDWVEDPQLDRSKVSKVTAEKLRHRMNSCKCLCYATTPSSSESKWMPWECGYMDGKKNRVAILPLTEHGGSFVGQEYLGIYPYVDEAPPNGESENILWVNESANYYCKFRPWLDGANPTYHQNG